MCVWLGFEFWSVSVCPSLQDLLLPLLPCLVLIAMGEVGDKAEHRRPQVFVLQMSELSALGVFAGEVKGGG